MGATDPKLPWHPGMSGVGWHSTRESKHLLLGDLRKGLAGRGIILHDEATVGELQEYVHYEDGGVGPSKLVEEAQGAREAHGDRVIATAGLCRCMDMTAPTEAKPKEPPVGSYAWMQAQEAKEAKRAEDWE